MQCVSVPTGASEAQFTLGQYYFTRGLYTEALGYFERAIDTEDSWGQAKYQLGVMYYDGLGVQLDMVTLYSYS